MSQGLDVSAARAALAPVREALLARAQRDADTRVRTARQEADAALDAARDQARDAVALARTEADADSRASLAKDLARARRHSRGQVLAAQRAAYLDLLDACRAAARRLADDPDWPAVHQRLVARAEALLATEARVEEGPDGTVVRTDTRLVDLGLDALAEAQVQALGPELERLWST